MCVSSHAEHSRCVCLLSMHQRTMVTLAASLLGVVHLGHLATAQHTMIALISSFAISRWVNTLSGARHSIASPRPWSRTLAAIIRPEAELLRDSCYTDRCHLPVAPPRVQCIPFSTVDSFTVDFRPRVCRRRLDIAAHSGSACEGRHERTIAWRWT